MFFACRYASSAAFFICFALFFADVYISIYISSGFFNEISSFLKSELVINQSKTIFSRETLNFLEIDLIFCDSSESRIGFVNSDFLS